MPGVQSPHESWMYDAVTNSLRRWDKRTKSWTYPDAQNFHAPSLTATTRDQARIDPNYWRPANFQGGNYVLCKQPGCGYLFQADLVKQDLRYYADLMDHQCRAEQHHEQAHARIVRMRRAGINPTNMLPAVAVQNRALGASGPALLKHYCGLCDEHTSDTLQDHVNHLRSHHLVERGKLARAFA